MHILGEKRCIVECYIAYYVFGNDSTNVVFGFLYNTKYLTYTMKQTDMWYNAISRSRASAMRRSQWGGVEYLGTRSCEDQHYKNMLGTLEYSVSTERDPFPYN
jgi:hypothetical protein